MPINERAIFDAALEIVDPKARRAFVEKACENNAELQVRVLSLLKSHSDAGSFLEIPAVDPLKNAACDATANTFVGDSGEADDDNDDDNDDRESNRVDLSFLRPSKKAGSIGTLGHYEILAVLGQGGFGVVFKAFDEKLHRQVAIKVMNPQMAATSPPRKRFLREARSAAAIRHENIVAVHSVEEQPLPYLVMEFIDGQTLQQKLDSNGPLDITEVLYLGQQIANGLAAAHALNLIHRDIKPCNILIEGNAEQKVKITDFGLARASDDASLTRSGMIAGTPMYMAPEQAMGLPLDHRTDLFSLGSVLYQMACGRPPFRAPSTIAVLRRVAEDTPRALQEIMPELPDWLVVIINTLLAKKPEDRYQSAKEVAELFGKCRTELRTSGKVTGIEAPMSTPSSEPISQTKREQIAAMKPAEPSLGRVLYFIALGVFITFPILFGRHLNSYINARIWPAIPVLPVNALPGGLEFDGKDDFVSVEPVNWSYAQFTIEAFVTSAPDSDNGTIVQLESGGDKPERMSLYDDHQADPGKRLSGAAIEGKTPFANTSAPLTPGVRQHRVLVFDGRYMHYYVNGIWKAKRFAEAHEGLMWKMKNLRIACDGSERQFFQGRIDQVRISRVARYDDNFAPITSLTSDDSTLALYNFDEGMGDVLKDASGNGHHGKIVGATWIMAKAEAMLPPHNSTKVPPFSDSKSLISNSPGGPTDAPGPAISPFNAEQAMQHQEAWAKYLNVPVEYVNTIGMTFRLIPPGEFLMGSTTEEMDAAYSVAGDDVIWKEHIRSEGPQHKVVLTRPLYVGIHEVTQDQYEKVMGVHVSYFSANGIGKDLVAGIDSTGNLPVETVSWNDAAEFCAKLSDSEQRKPVYSRTDETVTLIDGNGYRLPTEATWEFACRAGTTTKLWTGDEDEPLLNAAWFKTNAFDRTHDVGELKANPFGLHDTHGNVWEWVEDHWDAGAYNPFESQPAIDPTGPSAEAGSRHGLRGGDWVCMPSSCRSSHRHVDSATARFGSVGFRVTLPVSAIGSR